MEVDPTLVWKDICRNRGLSLLSICVDINSSSDVTCGVLDGWVSIEGCENYKKIFSTLWRESIFVVVMG